MTDPRPPLSPSDASPCAGCPWRTTNHGKRHPDGWYTRRNQDRLWAGLRNGSAMSCHPTDSGNEVSPAAQAKGYRPAPEGAQVLECRGGVILQQRELHLLGEVYGAEYAPYRQARPGGLTRAGVGALVMRLAFGGVPIIGGTPMGRPDLDAPVGHHRLSWPGLTAGQA